MASELLSASLAHQFQLQGNRWSDLIDDNVGSRLDNVRWSTACNIGFDKASATVLGLDGNVLIPEGQAAAILYWWRFAVLRIYMRGESAWVGRIWGIDLGELVEDEHVGVSRTVSITLKGIGYDLALRPAFVPTVFTEEGATTTVSDLVEAAIDQHGALIARNFDAIGSTSIDAGQVSATLGDYWLDLIIRALQTGDNRGVEWTFLVYEPEAGPLLVPRGEDNPRWLYPAIGAGIGVRWNGGEYASEVVVNYTDAANSTAAVDVARDDEALLLHHNIPAGRTINVDGASGAGAEFAAQTYLALHGNPVAPTDRLTIIPTEAPFAQLAGPEGALEPGWRVQAGQVIDLYGLLPSDARWRHMRKHNIESTDYDDNSGVLNITLDQRRIRARSAEDPVDIRRQWAALAPSRPRGMVKQFETEADDYSITNTAKQVDTFGEAGSQCVFNLTMDTQVKITFFALISPVGGATGRLTIGVDVDAEGFDADADLNRSARNVVEMASTDRRTLEGVYQTYLPAGEHVVQLWAEAHSSLVGSTLVHGRVIVEG